ncbi:MAG TPA: hypothetical protein VKL19_10010, partial [Thermoanaerobaculia bacterium]|nr:hypothetical protein [Thermoanaerobaculia bacterium]
MLAHGASFTFATVTQVLNSEVHRERIRITIPDANGISHITGDAGALPAGWQAVAVRRNKDFIVRYQGTAAGDGSFSFAVGNGGDPADRVDMGDLIDLQVISNIGNVAAIFALTPFVTEDGKGFVVPAGMAVRYTTPEGLTLDVPAGAFDVPTVINVSAAKKEEFLEIPSVEAENEYIGSVHIDFAGDAKKPLMFEAPVPAGFDTTDKQFILAEKAMSLRGPRLAVIDILRVDNNKFTTTRDPNEQNQMLTVVRLDKGVSQTLTGSKFSKYMRMLLHSGIFMYLDIRQPVGGSVGWGVMDGMQGGYDLTWDIFASYFIPFAAVVERGGALLPIITGRRFTVVGTDPGTGLQAFSRTYDPIPFGPPGTVTPIASAQQNDGGPYPVFGNPFRVEMLDLDVEQVDIKSIRNFTVRLDSGSVRIAPGTPQLDPVRNVELLNVTKGTFTSGTSSAPLTLEAKAGDRIVLLIEERDVEQSSGISVAFSEPVYTGASPNPDAIDTFLHGRLQVEQASEPVAGASPVFTDITSQARFTTDSGSRRINVVLSSALQREAVYRLTLKSDLADVINGEPGLKLGQGTIDTGGVLAPIGGGNAFHLIFHVRKPAGALGAFTVGDFGLISGMDLAGNVLFVAAQNGGLLAFDVSNPAALAAGANPIASVPGLSMPGGIGNTLAITIDRHNRVYTTAQMPASGVFRSYRVEDFVAGTPTARGSALISWKIGFSQMIGLPSNTVVSDRPESIPFRIKVLLLDDEKNFANRQAFIDGIGAQKVTDYPDDLQSFRLTVGRDGTPYAMQRVTVENLTLDMRWSADATDAGPAVLTNIIARSTDKLRFLRNQKTFAVVAHLGYGIGIYDANGIESNRFRLLPSNAFGHITEQLVLTAGKIARECGNATPDYGIIENYLNTDAELRGDTSGNIFAYAPDPYRGVLDLKLSLPGPQGGGTRDDDCDQRSSPNYGGLLFRSTPDGQEASRIRALHSAFVSAAGREPFNHFTQVAQFHWSITAAENSKGLRGTLPNSAAERDYLLVAGFDYGLVVVDINGDPPVTNPWPLTDENIADIIWVPGGVAGIRVYQSAHIAVVNDRFGRVYLVDLSRMDERWGEDGAPTSGLFPTARKALSGTPADPYSVGSDDPRILWKSEPGVTSGTLAPVFDVNTGIIFAGAMAQRQVKILSALDPHLQVKVNIGEESGLSEVGGIVPLGIAPPKDIQDKINALPGCSGNVMRCRENASLGVFRLELALPGNMVDSLTQSNNELQLAIESERVAGAITEQTPDGFPRAHLRRTRRDG